MGNNWGCYIMEIGSGIIIAIIFGAIMEAIPIVIAGLILYFIIKKLEARR